MSTRRQRLATFVAHHSNDLFPMARTFIDRLSPAFPPIRRMVRLGDKTSRFDFACVVSTLCKHADDLSAVTPMVESLGDWMTDLGFTHAHLPAARAAFLQALRQHAGADWNAQIEYDWAEVCTEFCKRMNLSAAAPAMRMAA